MAVTESRMPVIIDAMPTTTITPMAMPRMVSAARVLLARRASTASRMPFGGPGQQVAASQGAVHSCLSASMGSSREACRAG